MGTKTALEWLWEQIPFEYTSSRAAFDVYQQAKEIEKQQIIEVFPLLLSGVMHEESATKEGENYYTKTYGGGNE